MSMTDETRIAALSEHTGYGAETYEVETYDDRGPIVTDGGWEYLVLTGDEADEAVTLSVKESLWAFNGEFLAEHTGLPVEVFRSLAEMCEDANEAVRAIVDRCGDLDRLVSEAIAADGRGHFLAGYDHEEIELSHGLYAYRIN